MAARFLGCMDELPAFVNSACGGHFHSHVFARAHGVNRHRTMRIPFRTYIYKVYIFAQASLAPGIGTLEHRCRRATSCFQSFVCHLQLLRVHIHDVANLGIVDKLVAFEGFHAALP